MSSNVSLALAPEGNFDGFTEIGRWERASSLCDVSAIFSAEGGHKVLTCKAELQHRGPC